MSSGHRHNGVKLGDREVDEALANPVVRKALAGTRRVDRTWDIPYLGGYSVDGRTIYLDRHLPGLFKIRPGKATSLTPYLMLHEEVEKALIDELKMTYAHAHEVATRAEERAVRSAGIDVDWYRKTLKPMIKGDAKERLLRVPKDLDMTPYRAPPVDEGLIREILRARHEPSAAGKISPAAAHYGTGHPGSRCGLCVYFSPPHGCTVIGRAQADHWCSYFAKAYQPQENHDVQNPAA